MGKRDRLRKQAIIEGKVRSIAQARQDLMPEVIKRASWELFYNPKWDEGCMQDTYDDIAKVVVGVLPDALKAIGETRFHIDDISKDKDWLEMCCRMMMGILARNKKEFRKTDNKGEIWYLRKNNSGRKMNGEWRLCIRCGSPFYVSRSRWKQIHHSRDCYWSDYRAGNIQRKTARESKRVLGIGLQTS